MAGNPYTQSTGTTLNFGGPTSTETEDTDYFERNIEAIAKLMQHNPEEGEAMLRAYSNRTEHSDSFMSGLWNGITAPVRGEIGRAHV